MKAVETFKERVPFLRGKPRLSRGEALAVVPVRNTTVEWSESEGEVTLSIPLRKDKFARVVERVFRYPDRKQIVLDEVGSTVWELCDGKRDIGGIVREVSARYKLGRREAETSVAAFFKVLAQRKLIGLAGGGKQSK